MTKISGVALIGIALTYPTTDAMAHNFVAGACAGDIVQTHPPAPIDLIPDGMGGMKCPGNKVTEVSSSRMCSEQHGDGICLPTKKKVLRVEVEYIERIDELDKKPKCFAYKTWQVNSVFVSDCSDAL